MTSGGSCCYTLPRNKIKERTWNWHWELGHHVTEFNDRTTAKDKIWLNKKRYQITNDLFFHDFLMFHVSVSIVDMLFMLCPCILVLFTFYSTLRYMSGIIWNVRNWVIWSLLVCYCFCWQRSTIIHPTSEASYVVLLPFSVVTSCTISLVLTSATVRDRLTLDTY